MKLKLNVYPGGTLCNISFLHPDQKGIALEFARRLSAFAATVGMHMAICSGNRSNALQTQLYNENCQQYPPNGNGYVAYPGTSWHNGRCAIDIDTSNAQWQAHMMAGDMHKTVGKQELNKFGLCLPMNYIDCASVFEWWHIQPIETLGWSGTDKSKFLDTDDLLYGKDNGGDMTIIEFQARTGLDQDGQVGPATVAMAQEALECIGEIFKSPVYQGPKLVVAGAAIPTEVIEIAGTSYIPVRVVAQAVGKTVGWNEETKTILLT